MDAEPRRRIRPLEESDLVAADGLLRESFADPWSTDQLRAELDRGAWALEVDGTLAGLACLSLVPPEAELLMIVVGSRYRGRGFGGRLLEELIGRVRAAGCRELRLEVRSSARAALALYRGRGFVEVGRRRGYYERGTIDAVLMTATLEPPRAQIAGRGDGRV